MSIQLDVIEPHVTGYSRVTLDIAAAVRTASATKINDFILYHYQSLCYIMTQLANELLRRYVPLRYIFIYI